MRHETDAQRRAILEYLAENGPSRAAVLVAPGMGHTSQLIWLQKEGYILCNMGGTKNALWEITPYGRRSITPVAGVPAAPRRIAYEPWVQQHPDLAPQVMRAGALRAFELQSRGQYD